LPEGLDGAAHRGCIDSNGSTIAVLGCGIDIVYPKEHRQLADKNHSKWLLLTEFVPGTSPAPQISGKKPHYQRLVSGNPNY